MNITLKTNLLKTNLALGAAGLSLLALAGGASAQTTVGDPALTTVFSDFNGRGLPNFTTSAIGLGYDLNLGGGKLPVSTNSATAQSVYEPFVFDSSAVGAFATLAAGTQAQLQVFAANNNVNTTGGNTNPFNIYATLYAFNPNAAANAVPVMGPDLFGTPQKVTLGQIATGYFSGDFTLTGAVTAGQTYVLGLTTLNNDTQDFAQVGETVFNGQSGLAAGDATPDTTKYITDNGDQGTPTTFVSTNTTGNVIAFRFAAAPGPSPVPEASSAGSMGLLLGLGAAFLAVKRRRAVAK